MKTASFPDSSIALSLEKIINNWNKREKSSTISLESYAMEHNIEIREYSGPGFMMSNPKKPGHKLLYVDSDASYEEKQKWIAKGIVHSVLHSGDQTHLPIETIKEQEEQAEVGAKIILDLFV